MPVPIKNNSKEEETCKSVRDLMASIPYSVYSPKQILLCLQIVFTVTQQKNKLETVEWKKGKKMKYY